MRIDLLIFKGSAERLPAWSHGSTVPLSNTPAVCASEIETWLAGSDAEFALFWQADTRVPEPHTLAEISDLPGDVWHAGLRLGMSGSPRAIDFVRPTWMFACDPDDSIVATSWRIHLHACLIRTEVLRQLGGMDAGFDTLEGAGLDMGHRYLAKGAIVRHVPQLLGPSNPQCTSSTEHDELRFVRNQYGRRWLYWAAFRAIAAGWAPLEVLRAVGRVQAAPALRERKPYQQPPGREGEFDRSKWHERISILIPTLDRYDYLRNELLQLRGQSLRPKDILIVDQTNPPSDAPALLEEFATLPIRYIHQTTTGQCTAWNAALHASRGEYLLFLGDDADRLAPDFLERFARRFDGSGADMVASVVEEVGAGPPPESCGFVRVSDIFPIAMIKRDVLRATGLMDFAYDRGKRADGDLAMRCYLAGALMILDPSINPLHHRAPRGGLRKHGVRVITRGSSRRSIRQRHLPSASEIYLALRYFGPRQLREELWIQTVSSWSGSGSAVRRVLKLMYGLLCLPDTLFRLRREYKQARLMQRRYPQIPSFDLSGRPNELPSPASPAERAS